MSIPVTRRTGSGLAVLGLVLVAALACGAARNKGDKPSGKLEPTSYDPRVSLAPLVERVAPAVVNIRTAARMPSLHGFMGPDSLFEWFFGPQGGRRRPQPEPEPGPLRRSMGSGFIIDGNGLVVTNHHVVESAEEIEVQLADDRTFDATLVGSDERTDVALLKLVDAKGLPSVEFGDSSALKVGDHVVAIGNPFGLDHTVTSGIVSAKERVIGAGPYDDFIQTDASINPGNSGGPLFNLRGEVVGINTAIAPRGQGIGFAIPSNLARDLIDSLRDDGRVVRGWLGIAFQPLDHELAAAFGLDDTNGAVVANIEPGSPAERGGLEVGDVIVKVDGKPLKSGRALPAVVARLEPGKRVPFAVVRKGKRRTLKVEIGELPDERGAQSSPSGGDEPAAADADLGFAVRDLDDGLRRRLGLEDGQGGAVVARVQAGSAASRVLRAGDVIVEVNRDRVGSAAEFEKLTGELKAGDDLLVLVYRRGAWLYLVLRL